MAEYYLISQLPSLDGLSETAPPPISEARFFELCGRFCKKKTRAALENLTLSPPREKEETGFSLIDAWNESERNLRFALGQVRAEKMKKSFDTGNRMLPVEYIRAAGAAMEEENPMEAEKMLNRTRMEILESLRPADSFSEEYLFYYGLKLKLISRIRQFDRAEGIQAYKTIYNSIVNGDRTETEQ